MLAVLAGAADASAARPAADIDPSWNYVDLGVTYAADRVQPTWDAPCATAYRVEVSLEPTNWTAICTTTSGKVAWRTSPACPEPAADSLLTSTEQVLVTGIARGRLRFSPDGSIPADNPFHNAVWSYGHRNVQGLAFDSQGRLWEQ